MHILEGFLVLFVDEILLASNDKGLLHEVKQFLSKNFDLKDMSEASYVIGLRYLETDTKES